MANSETVVPALQGFYQDVLYNRVGHVMWESGWQKNTIVADCHRLLAGFMHGGLGTAGIQGLQVGAGSDTWDQTGAPQPTPATTALIDARPFVVPAASLTFEYLTGAVV